MKILETKRTIIRPFKDEDFNGLREMMSDPEVMGATGFKEPQTD